MDSVGLTDDGAATITANRLSWGHTSGGATQGSDWRYLCWIDDEGSATNYAGQGLGAAALQDLNPNLIYLSASGMGRTGPEAGAVAYGTLLQCYSGFAGLNRHPDRPPRVGMAWLDPMCGLVLPFLAAAAVWRT